MLHLLITVITLLGLSVFNGLAINGFYKACEPEMIFGAINYIKMPLWLEKPLYLCPTCMASIHSTYVFIPVAISFGVSFWWYPAYILVTAAVSTIINRMIEPEIKDNDTFIGAN